MFRGIDLFSDTVTQPTDAMRQAMAMAPVGDEQLGEDPTTAQLETRMSELLGTSAAMFFPSATMANEVAIRLHCQPGDELIAADNCHLFEAESGGPAIHAQVLSRMISCERGIFTGEMVEEKLNLSASPYSRKTSLISIENTSNMGGGYAWTLDELNSVKSVAKKHDIALHLDGARLFNAATKSDLSPKTIASGCDTITVCLSKGLGCPTGAILGFAKEHWTSVRRLKQLMGGSMRQSGILAAAGLHALEHHISRLSLDHRHAKQLAVGLSDLGPKIAVENTSPDTNMIFFRWKGSMSPSEFSEACQSNGVRFSQVGQDRFRGVTHLGIDEKKILRAIQIVSEVCSGE